MVSLLEVVFSMSGVMVGVEVVSLSGLYVVCVGLLLLSGWLCVKILVIVMIVF